MFHPLLEHTARALCSLSTRGLGNQPLCLSIYPLCVFILWNLSSSGVEKHSGHNLHLNDSPLYIILHVGIRYLDFNISTLDVCSAKIPNYNLHQQTTPTLLNQCFIPAKSRLPIFRNSLLKKCHTVSLVTIKSILTVPRTSAANPTQKSRRDTTISSET
jgi:hypothetical protein